MSFLLRLGRLLPPKSPKLGNFETKGLGLKSPNLGDLGGISRLKQSDEDLCVHGSLL